MNSASSVTSSDCSPSATFVSSEVQPGAEGGMLAIAMDPVVELSGEISEVEDVSSAIMQSSASTTSLRDEDEYATGAGGLAISKGDQDATVTSGPNKKRFYAMAVVLVTLFAGCGYIVTSRELAKDTHDKKDQEGLSPFSVPTLSGMLNNSANSSSSASPAPQGGNLGPVSPTTWSSAIDGDALVRSGSAFQIALRSANSTNRSSASLCLDLFQDVAATPTASSTARTLVFRKCTDSPDTIQAFVFDPLNRFIMSKFYKGWCVDSSHFGYGANAPHAPARLRLHPCGLKTWNQMFTFAPDRGEFKSTHLATCIASAATATQSQATLHRCGARPTTTLRAVVTRVWDVAHPVLLSGEPFQLRSVGKLSVCLSTHPTNSSEEDTNAVVTGQCNSRHESQQLTYDAQMHWIQSPGSHSELCLDDSDAWPPDPNDAGVDPNTPTITSVNRPTAYARMAPCDAQSYNQKFVYDAFARTFRSPAKPDLCLDDGGGTVAHSAAFRMAKCDLVRGNQQFALEPIARLRERPRDDAQQAFSIESMDKALCVASDFRLRECDRDALTQRFVYGSKRQSVHSAVEPSHCWSRSAQPASAAYFGVAFLSMAPCDAEDARQRFEADVASATLRSVGTREKSGGLCLDDGGGWFARETPLMLRECAEHSTRQRFRVWR